MWQRPTMEVQKDAMELLLSARLRDPPRAVYDVEPDRIFFIAKSGSARVATVHCSGASRIVRSIYPGWPA